MEMADGVVIHKADGDNLASAKKAKANYQNALHLFPLGENGWSPKIVLASSVSGEGLEKVWKMIRKFEEKMRNQGFWDRNRAKQRLNWLDDQIRVALERAFLQNPTVQKELNQQKPKVQSGELNPRTLAQALVQLLFPKL
jgi:LAO/AO transport system kinase